MAWRMALTPPVASGLLPSWMNGRSVQHKDTNSEVQTTLLKVSVCVHACVCACTRVCACVCVPYGAVVCAAISNR